MFQVHKRFPISSNTSSILSILTGSDIAPKGVKIGPWGIKKLTPFM